MSDIVMMVNIRANIVSFDRELEITDRQIQAVVDRVVDQITPNVKKMIVDEVMKIDREMGNKLG